MGEIDSLARAAWEGTRSEHAVPYDELEPAYRDNLLRRAEAVLGGAPPTGPWEVYEKQVCQLASTNTEVGAEMAMAAEIPEEVKEELVEEVQEEAKPKKVTKKAAPKKVATKKPVKVVKAVAKPVAKKK